MIDVISDYQPYLLPASIAGISFWMVDSRDDPGRRVVRFLFPGQDQADFQDLGADQGEIRITGLYVGDDYIQAAAQLRSALRDTSGPWTLQHPWLGELQVVQAPGRRPEISFKQDELRVVRISASFAPYSAPIMPAPDTLADLLCAAANLRTDAQGLLSAVLAPVAITLSAVAYVENFCAALVTTWTTLVANAANALVAPAAAIALAALGLVDTLALDSTFPATLAAALGGISAAIAGTTTPIRPAVVAPGGATAAPAPVDGRITAGLILSAVATMATHNSDAAPGPTIAVAAQMLALADACTAASDIVFDSQQEAMQWLGNLRTALTTATTQAALLAAVQPVAAGTAWRGLEAMKAKLSDDMNTIIGRLPAVTTFIAPSSVPVWLLAQYLSGDNPGQVRATYLDLVKRNGIINPAVAPGGPLEVLLP